MSFALALVKRLVRAFVSMIMLASSVLGVFLAGYFLGWQGSPSESRTTGGRSMSAAAVDAGTKTAAAGTGFHAIEDHDGLASRLSRLAAWLAPTRHRRSSEARVLAEIGRMPAAETQAALSQLERAPDSSVVSELRSHLLLRWASTDPGAAFDYWQRNSDRIAWKANVASDLFIQWASRDPNAALAHWRLSEPELADIDSAAGYALRQIFSQLARKNFTQAMVEAGQFTGEYRQEAMQGVASVPVSDENRGAFLQNLLALPAGTDRGVALTAAVSSWFSSGKNQEAIQWLDAQPLEPAERTRIQDEIARRWFMKDRLAAADWLVGRATTPAERAHALEQITFQWTQFDPIACGEWLVRQGTDPSASRAMQIYADRLASSFPADAVTWARSIPDPASREIAVAKVAERIRRLHPDRAAELLGSGR